MLISLNIILQCSPMWNLKMNKTLFVAFPICVLVSTYPNSSFNSILWVKIHKSLPPVHENFRIKNFELRENLQAARKITVSPLSSMVERQSPKLEVRSSILRGGVFFFKGVIELKILTVCMHSSCRHSFLI